MQEKNNRNVSFSFSPLFSFLLYAITSQNFLNASLGYSVFLSCLERITLFVKKVYQGKENKSSDSVIFVSETKNESGSYFGDNELSASETLSFSGNSLPPDYMEQLKNLYAGVGSKILSE